MIEKKVLVPAFPCAVNHCFHASPPLSTADRRPAGGPFFTHRNLYRPLCPFHARMKALSAPRRLQITSLDLPALPQTPWRSLDESLPAEWRCPHSPAVRTLQIEGHDDRFVERKQRRGFKKKPFA